MSSLANGRASGQNISKVLWTLPHFLLVAHVHTRVHPEAWWARMCRHTAESSPPGMQSGASVTPLSTVCLCGCSHVQSCTSQCLMASGSEIPS